MKNQEWKHDKATDAWQALRIHGEFIKGFDELTELGPCISLFGSARTQPKDPYYIKATELSKLIVKNGYGVITGGGSWHNGGRKFRGIICRWSISRNFYRITF